MLCIIYTYYIYYPIIIYPIEKSIDYFKKFTYRNTKQFFFFYIQASEWQCN